MRVTMRVMGRGLGLGFGIIETIGRCILLERNACMSDIDASWVET